jgi:hypothetical protein
MSNASGIIVPGQTEPSTGFVKFKDHDFSARESKDIRQKSDSEPIIEEGYLKAEAIANELGQRWAARNKKEAVTKWYCPLETGKSRKLFDSKKECSEYIKKELKNSVKLAKLEGKKAKDWAPQSVEVSPKRTLADLVPEHHLPMYQAALQGREKAQDLGRVALAQAQQNKYTVGVLVGMMESEAISRIKHLSDKDLQDLVTKAFFRGRRRLYKAARELCATRQIKPPC